MMLTFLPRNHRADDDEASLQLLQFLCCPYLLLVIDTVYDEGMVTFFG